MIFERQYNNFIIILAILSFCLVGCAQKTTVVLLPDPDGKTGQLTVSTEAGTTEISRARESTVIKSRKSLPTKPEILTENEVIEQFSPVLTILPAQPEHFILYFRLQSTGLTAASKKMLPEVLQSIDRRKSQNISVIGHTDTAGDRRYNLQLSEKRAETVRTLLIKKGVKATYIDSTSHGEENPLVKTADNVHEPRNRRVEVVVR